MRLCDAAAAAAAAASSLKSCHLSDAIRVLQISKDEMEKKNREMNDADFLVSVGHFWSAYKKLTSGARRGQNELLR